MSHDHCRGAAEIVNDIASLFLDIAGLAEKNPNNSRQLFTRAVRRLANGQPSMAPVLNLLNHLCRLIQQSKDNWRVFSSDLTPVLDDWKSLSDRMLQHIDEIPRQGSKLVTFSNSSTVAKCIIACHEKFNWPSEVICGEGRPILEGRILSRRLQSAGVKVTLCTDAALMSGIVDADIVWIGGDALSRLGLANKMGSRALALLAQAVKIPFVSLITSDKLLPPGLLPYYRFLPQNPREIADGEAVGLNVINEYYENVPLKLITSIFSERGKETPKKFLASVEHLPVSDLFIEIVQG